MRQNRLGYLFLAFYFTFIGGGAYYALSFPIRIAHHGLVTLLMGIYLWRRIRKGQGLAASPLDKPIWVAICVWFLTSLTSLDPRMSFEHLWLLLIHVLLFYILVDLIQRGSQRMLIEIMLFMGAVVLLLSGIELALWFADRGINLSSLIAGNFPNLADLPSLSMALSVSTLQGGYLAPLVLLATAWAKTTPRRDYRHALIVLTVLLFGALVLTKSRGGLLSLLVASGVWLTFALAHSTYIRRFLAPQWILTTGLLAGIAGMIAYVYLTIPFGIGASNDQRFDMYQSAVEMTVTQPLTGVGVGMFGRAFRDYRNPAIAQDKLASAHNLYLNTSAETGLLGLGVGAWLFMAWAWASWQHWKNAPYRGYQQRIEFLVAALLGMAAHSMVEFFSVTPLVLLILTLGTFTMIPSPKSRLDSLAKTKSWTALAALAILLIYALAFIPLDYAYARYLASMQSDNLESLQQAQALDPFMRLYQLHEAYLLGKAEDTAAAITAYQEALAFERTWDMGWVNLGALAERIGNPQAALEHYERARQIDYRNVTAHLQWGRVAETHHLASEEAIFQAYAAAINNQRDYRLPLSEFWSETALRQAFIQDYVADLPLHWAYRILRVHAPESAFALVPTAPQSYEAWWVLGEYQLEEENNPQAASTSFSRALELAPSHEQGDMLISRARAFAQFNREAALQDLNQAQRLSSASRFEYPNIVRATLATNTQAALNYKIEAIPLLVERQEFAATLYQRPASFDHLPEVRYPYVGGQAVNAWLDVADSYLADGRTADARRALIFILLQDPYNSLARQRLEALNG